MTPASLPKLLDLLAGSGLNTELIGGLLRDRAGVAARRWEAWWAEHPALLPQWGKLDAAQRERIEAAPEAWTLVTGAHYGEADLARWIAAEARGEGWSASGEFCDGEPRAVRLAGGTLVDWQSPAAVEPIPEIHGSAVATPVSEAADARRNIDGAAAILRGAAPRWLQLIGHFDAVILLRTVPLLKDFNSATTRLALGRPVLRNAHLPVASPDLIADALVHETVHTVLDYVELTCPLVRDERRCAGQTIRSGWTGRDLDLNTFVHACMVWFANFHLWLNAARTGAIDLERNVSLLMSRSRGFFARPARQLERFADALAPGVLEMVGTAECQVLDLLG